MNKMVLIFYVQIRIVFFQILQSTLFHFLCLEENIVFATSGVSLTGQFFLFFVLEVVGSLKRPLSGGGTRGRGRLAAGDFI